MAIAIVQSKTFNGASSGNFNSAVTPGNTIFIWVYQYSSAGSTMTSSNPTYNGASVAGATALLPDSQFAGANSVWNQIWMLPNVTGSSTAISVTPTGGTFDTNVGMSAIEVSGLGTSPSIDSAASPDPKLTTGQSTAPASGSTGNITSSPELILSTAVGFAQNLSTPGAPWTTQNASGFSIGGWQIATSPGSSYSFTPVNSSGSASWSAAVVTIKSSAPAVTPAVTSVPVLRWPYFSKKYNATPNFFRGVTAVPGITATVNVAAPSGFITIGNPIQVSDLTNGSNTSASSAVTNSITPAPNCLLLLWTGAWDGGAGNTTSVSSVTGLGLTWTQLTTILPGGVKGQSGLWYAVTGSNPGSGAITINLATASAICWDVDQVTGVNLSSP